MNKKIKKKLPQFFKPLFWYCDFSKFDLRENKEEIMIQTINYGDWQHWQWLFNYYGREETKKIIKDIPFSAFRKRILKLIFLIFKINKLKYASRSDRIKAQKNISKA
ncbi:MAG: hypothetical protein Q8N58_02545 [bacterium]|nr:hypothetical protein [bacterium]